MADVPGDIRLESLARSVRTRAGMFSPGRVSVSISMRVASCHAGSSSTPSILKTRSVRGSSVTLPSATAGRTASALPTTRQFLTKLIDSVDTRLILLACVIGCGEPAKRLISVSYSPE